MTEVSWVGSDFSGFTYSAPVFPTARYTYDEGGESPALAAGDVIIIASSEIGGGSITGPPGATVDFDDTWTDPINSTTYAARLTHYVVGVPGGLSLDTDFSSGFFDLINIAGMVISGAGGDVTFHGPHREGSWTELGEKDVPYGDTTDLQIVFNEFGGPTGYYHTDAITGYYSLGAHDFRVYWHWIQGNTPSGYKVDGVDNFSPFDQAAGSGQNFGPLSAGTHAILLATPHVENVVRVSHNVRRGRRLSVS